MEWLVAHSTQYAHCVNVRMTIIKSSMTQARLPHRVIAYFIISTLMTIWIASTATNLPLLVLKT